VTVDASRADGRGDGAFVHLLLGGALSLGILVPLGPNPASFTELVWALHQDGRRVDQAQVLLESEEAQHFWRREVVDDALPQLQAHTGPLDIGWEVLPAPSGFAERLWDHLRALQRDHEEVVVALSAGRWRGSTAHTAAVFQLLARPQDALVDVRVDRVAEGGSGFFFPQQRKQELVGVAAMAGRGFLARDVQIHLEPQRTPRLRVLLPTPPERFEQALTMVERALAPAVLQLDPPRVNGVPLKLSPSARALLAVLVRNGPTSAWDTDTLKPLLKGRRLTGVLGRLARGHDLDLDELQRLSQNWSRMRARIRKQVHAQGLPEVAIPQQRRVGDASVWRLDDKLVIRDGDG